MPSPELPPSPRADLLLSEGDRKAAERNAAAVDGRPLKPAGSLLPSCLTAPVTKDDSRPLKGHVSPSAPSSGRRLLACGVVASLLLNVALFGLVGWLIHSVRQLHASILNPSVSLSVGPTAPSGYSSWGSLFRGSGTWVVANKTLPWGGLSDHGAVARGDYLYVFGGAAVGHSDGASPLFGQMWRYDTIYESYARLADQPVASTRFAFALLGDLIFLVGGFAGDAGVAQCWNGAAACPASGVPLATVGDVLASNPGWAGWSTSVFNITSGAWLATLPGGRALSSLRLGTSRSDACAAVVGSKVYVAGGYGLGYNISDAFEMLDTAVTPWAWVPLPPLPSPRGDVSCAALGGQVYVFGGYYNPDCAVPGLGCFPTANGTNLNLGSDGGVSNFHAEMWSFDPAAGSWTARAPMRYARGDNAFAGLVNGRIVAAGGEHNLRTTSVKVPQHSVEMYHAAEDAWVEKAPLPYARFRFAAASVGQTTYAVGGQQICFTDPPPAATPYTAQSSESDAANAATTALPYCQLTAAATMSALYELDHAAVFVSLPTASGGLTYDDALFGAEFAQYGGQEEVLRRRRSSSRRS